jgi:quinoprotein glucose dehydrogenase
VAIDPATGETLWMWRMDGGERWEKAPRQNSGRGLGYWEDGSDRRIFTVTPGFRLVALDARTGRPVTEFGNDGVVDLFEGLRWRGDGPEAGAIGNSSPPLVIGDAVIVGPALKVGLRVESRANVPGDIRAFDTRTGAELWSFHTVPEKGEFGYDTWLDGSAEYSGNAGAWAPMAGDPDLGLVYVPVEAGTSDAYGGHRPGDNLFSSTLVALNAETGERVWHYQIVHHDIWDYDIAAHPILADVTVAGEPRKVVVQLTKQAFAYVLDRVTGEPIWPIEERSVPESDVPGEWTSPTQPFPSKPAAFDLQGLTHDDLNDLTPEVHRMALEAVKDYRLPTLYQPLSLVEAPDGTKGTIMVPGPSGGARWEAGSLDVETGILYVASATEPFMIGLLSDPDFSDLRYVASYRPFTLEGVIPLTRPPWGRITAIDLSTGDHLWWIPNGQAPREVKEHPALTGVDLSMTGKPLRALTLVTSTLLFAGEGLGGDPVLRALDKATGETVAELPLPAPQVGLAMTYVSRGRQFIVMTVGGSGHPAELIALALPE